MKAREKKVFFKVIEYIDFIADKPKIDTVFRKYYETLIRVKKLISLVLENPWHPDNDYSETIFREIDECFEELDEVKKKWC